MTTGAAPRSIILINPNTSASVTAEMVRIAAEDAPADWRVDGVTAAFGAPLILDPAALAISRRAVLDLVPGLVAAAPRGVIVSAFGDPALQPLRASLSCPVAGLGEASMARAGAGGRRFCVVTTTPELAPLITASAHGHGHAAAYAGTFCTTQDPASLMIDPPRLLDALLHLCGRVHEEEGVEAIIIGGGPLGRAARSLGQHLPVPVIEPIREAMRWLIHAPAAKP
ncbi:aspartate/glutamate racemase family protein [Aureimonas frigidaquae]|uniref:aspartate/glutamate racemase family protein n=1 Tax=Aureimonas frigidaquae TaxID=424757 RepID=UPI0007864F21|nr:aspartate/glutamate racemase family protein [Aureimonas frigidaquae]